MNTARRDPTRFLYLERQFCSLCRAQGNPGVRVVNVRDRLTAKSDAGFRTHRRALALAHLRAEHPKVYREVMG